jgi:ribose transport system permease protein
MSAEDQAVVERRAPAGAPGDGPVATGHRRTNVGWRLFERYGLVAAFILLALLFSLLKPDAFPTSRNAQSILTQNASLTLMALGVMLPLIVNRFDLSPGYMATMAGLLAVGFQQYDDWPVWAAVLAAVVASGIVGLINGVLIAKAGFNSLIVTLGSGSILFGIAQLYSDGATLFKNIHPGFLSIGESKVIGIPLPFVIALVVGVGIWYVLQLRPTGRRFYAIGGSEEGARLVGIHVDGLIIITFVASAVLAGTGGVLEATRVGSANATGLQSFLLPAFTAAFLGATAIKPGQYNVWGTFLAVYIVGMGTTGMFMLGAPSYSAQVFNGAVLLIAIALAQLSSRRLRKT